MVSQPVGRRLRRKEPEACLPGVTSIRIFTSYPVSSNVWRSRKRSHQKMTRKVPCLLRSNIKPQSCPLFFFRFLLLLLHPPPLRPTHQPHTTNIITRRLHLCPNIINLPYTGKHTANVGESTKEVSRNWLSKFARAYSSTNGSSELASKKHIALHIDHLRQTIPRRISLKMKN